MTILGTEYSQGILPVVVKLKAINIYEAQFGLFETNVKNKNTDVGGTMQ